MYSTIYFQNPVHKKLTCIVGNNMSSSVKDVFICFLSGLVNNPGVHLSFYVLM